MKKVKGLSSLKIKLPRVSSVKPTNPVADKLKEGEIVGGTLQGKKARADEMVLSKVLDKYKVNYMFRWIVPEVPGHFGLMGDVEVDFLISDGVLKPVQVADFQFVHSTPAQKERDKLNDDKVNKYFHPYGALPVTWVDALDLQNVEMAEFKVRQLGLV